MAIHLRKPYKIIEAKRKRYQNHYLIPAEKSVVIPVKALGEEVACDVRWENDNGELKELHNVVFINDNLTPLNPMIDDKLYEVWQHYYSN